MNNPRYQDIDREIRQLSSEADTKKKSGGKKRN